MPGWGIFELMHSIASESFDDGDGDVPSFKVFNAFHGARLEMLAGLESTYATFLPLAQRSATLIQALQGYDSLLEDLGKDMYLI